jgi:hypothetical protein
MKYKFNVNCDDNDYLDYNVFMCLKSPYGRNQMVLLRIFILACVAVSCLFLLAKRGFEANAWINIVPYIIFLMIMEVLLNPFLVWILKIYIKFSRKRGKRGYSPVSEFEFYDEKFIEITPDYSIEQKYSAVERISIITDKVVYIHINSLMAFILLINCFESEEQYKSFIEFLKTKCQNIDVY